MSSAIWFNLDQSKVLSSGNGLKQTVALKELLCVVIVKKKLLESMDRCTRNQGITKIMLKQG